MTAATTRVSDSQSKLLVPRLLSFVAQPVLRADCLRLPSHGVEPLDVRVEPTALALRHRAARALSHQALRSLLLRREHRIAPVRRLPRLDAHPIREIQIAPQPHRAGDRASRAGAIRIGGLA